MSKLHVFPGWIALAVLLAGFWTGSSATAAAAPDWPQFHGPKRDNISTETGLLEQWPPGGPRLLWTARGIGHGFASISIAGGLIYTTGNVDGHTVVTAMDLDGKIRWQVPNGKSWEEPQGGSRATPTLDGDRLYHKNPYGDVVCLDAKTGRKVWGLNLIERFHSKNINWGLAESLLIDGGHVICCPGGPETAVVALDKRTGETVWKSPTAGDLAGYASPCLAERRGLRMISTLTSRAVIGVGADTGDLLWRFEHVTPFGENTLMPICHDGQVFVSTHGTGSVMLKINVAGARASVAEVWRSKELDNHHGGVILLDGYLYGCSRNPTPKWICLDWKTGRTMHAAPGVGKGSLTYADGMLYTLSENRKMGLVEATPGGHEVISQFMLPEGGEGPSWAHPVVCGRRLYLRYSDALHAYDVAAE